MKKCPYCGRRISYASMFVSRRRGEYVCNRCGKESKVVISKLVFLIFTLFALIALAIMAGCFMTGNVNNPLSIVLVAIPLIIFVFVSPIFVNYEPLRKYKNSMEARKAGIEYSDNIAAAELEKAEAAPIGSSDFDTSDSFKINSDVFNKIKAERNAARAGLDSNEILSSSTRIVSDDSSSDINDGHTRLVPVIEDVRENHASASAPLRKIHSDNTRSAPRSRHYIQNEDDREQNKSDKRQSDTNRYSANRRF